MSSTPVDDRDSEQAEPQATSWRQAVIDKFREMLGWAMSNRLKAGLVLGACLASLLGVVLGWMMLVPTESADVEVTLDMTLEALDLGQYVKAREMAETLEKQQTLPFDELGGPAFVRGAATAYERDETWGKDKTRGYLLAARYLEEARDRGFPPGRRGEGLFLLGRSLYLAGKISGSRPILREALKFNKRKKTEIHRLLAEAYLGDANPQLDAALAENTLYLSEPKLPSAERHRGLAQRAQILLRLNRIDDCSATLAKIPQDARNRADAMVIQGRLLMREARMLKNKPDATAEEQVEATEKYEAARKTLRLAQGHDTLATQATRKASYLIGVCYREQGKNREALAQFARTDKLYGDLPEGLAASFQEAELSRQLNLNVQAMAAYRRVLGAIKRPEDFSNPWITLDELRARMLEAYQHYLKTEGFEIALQLTRDLRPLFPEPRVMELTADVYRQWGDSLLRKAADLPREKAEETARLGRAQLRRAGQTYSRLAKRQIATRQYTDWLWNSVNAFFRGQDYPGVVRTVRLYLKNDTRRRRPQALVYLGEAMLALDQIDEALEAFRECFENYPRDPASYRARLSAGKAYLEQGEFEKVETLLEENLSGTALALTPDSKEWRESLYELGELLHIQGRYQEAIERLDYKALGYVDEGRFPDDDQALNARYLVADSYRQAALSAQEKLRQDLPGAERATQSKQIRDNYDTALLRFNSLREMLSRRQELAELATQEKLILRNSYFAIGDIHFQMRDYEGAVKAYTTAINRYQSQPASLLAYLQIANAYRRLNDSVKARATVQQAKAVLARMKTDLPFAETTNYSRQQWDELLDSLSKL